MRIQYIILIMPCCLCEKLRKFSWEGKDCCQKSRLARLGFLGNLAKSCLRCCWTHRLATSTIFTSSEIWLSENMGKAVTVQLHLISDSSPYLYSYIAQTIQQPNSKWCDDRTLLPLSCCLLSGPPLLSRPLQHGQCPRTQLASMWNVENYTSTKRHRDEKVRILTKQIMMTVVRFHVSLCWLVKGRARAVRRGDRQLDAKGRTLCSCCRSKQCQMCTHGLSDPLASTIHRWSQNNDTYCAPPLLSGNTPLSSNIKVEEKGLPFFAFTVYRELWSPLKWPRFTHFGCTNKNTSSRIRSARFKSGLVCHCPLFLEWFIKL